MKAFATCTGIHVWYLFSCVNCGVKLKEGLFGKLTHPTNNCQYSGTKWKPVYPELPVELTRIEHD